MSTDIGERQPLLERDPAGDEAESFSLPYGQLAILAIWRAAQGLYFTYIFVFITRLLVESGVANETNVGTAAGWVEAAYSVGTWCGVFPGAILNDVVGRKPVAIVGVAFASFGTIAFGFAHNLAHLIVCRYIVGFFVGAVMASVPVILVEHSNPKTRPLIFGINARCLCLGDLAAPFFGVLFSKPAKSWPSIFKGGIFEEYPYALPGVMISMLPLLACIIGIPLLKETRPPEAKRTLKQVFRRVRKVEDPVTQQLPRLWTKPVLFLLFHYANIVALFLAFLVIEVLFLSTSHDVGGIDLPQWNMALLFGLRTLGLSIALLVAYPFLARRFSKERLYRSTVLFFGPALYLSYFIFGTASAYTSDPPLLSARANTALLFVLAAALWIPTCLRDVACREALIARLSHPAHLSTLNMGAEFAASVGHALGIVGGSNLWAMCVQLSVLRGQAAWFGLLAVTLVLGVLSLKIMPHEGEKMDDARADELVVPVDREHED